MELKDIKGVGPKRIKTLNEKGIFTCLDLLNKFPHKYLDFGEISGYEKVVGASLTTKAESINEAKSVFVKGHSYTIARFKDCTNGAEFNAIWFNQPFMKNNISEGEIYFLTGKINSKKQLVVTNYFSVEKLINKIIPVYSASLGISSAVMSKLVREILENATDFGTLKNEEILGISSLKDSYHEIHFPSSIERLENAKERVALEDLVLLASLEKDIAKSVVAKDWKYKEDSLEKFIQVCPYTLTTDQLNALTEIATKMDNRQSLNQLLLGDVGSGKTVVALGAIFKACYSGFQAALLCPTEILAKQHYETAKKVLENADGIKIGLLYSGLKETEKREILSQISTGELNVLITTHSVLSDKVNFKSLALVITDEQHRFGVGERAGLSLKGVNPDQLVMSATPIPRSLALVLFGGLGVSEINSRPFGESKIETNIVPMKKEAAMWQFIDKKLVETDGRCFVIASRIEDSAMESDIFSINDIKNKMLENGIQQSQIGIIHGKMEKAISDGVISDFREGKIKYLISTTVVEVGIDVKPANLMVVYNAERFGLASLHQLRGRIGRDGKSGYCFCLTDSSSDYSLSRLKVFKNNNNGIKIAEEDLKLRGSGTLYGTKQHGAKELFLNISFSLELYKKAQEIIDKLSVNELDELVKVAKQKYGDMFSKIVLN